MWTSYDELASLCGSCCSTCKVIRFHNVAAYPAETGISLFIICTIHKPDSRTRADALNYSFLNLWILPFSGDFIPEKAGWVPLNHSIWNCWFVLEAERAQ